jgi:hypothetical protein
MLRTNQIKRDTGYMIHSRSTLICPKCGKKMPVHFSAEPPERKHSLKLQCGCGYSWMASRERRRHYRKPVNLKGRYNYSNRVELDQGAVTGKYVGKGRMRVLDVSAWGLKMKVRKREDLHVNDQVYVEFKLDDDRKTLVKEKATVKNIDDRYIGGAFADRRTGNRSLGFYLLG